MRLSRIHFKTVIPSLIGNPDSRFRGNDVRDFEIAFKHSLCNYLYLLVVLATLSVVGSMLTQRAGAQTISNDNYQLQIQDLSIGNKSTYSIPPKPSVKGVKSAKNPYLTFSISQTNIDFGILSPTNPVARTNTLTVSTDYTNGYTVIAFQNQPLASIENLIIPDTTCDNGTCNEKVSSSWTSPLSYGLGYRCDDLKANACDKNFENVSFHKQFSNNKTEAPQEIMSPTNFSRTAKSQITYRVNVSGTQKPGFYSNEITYILVPNL